MTTREQIIEGARKVFERYGFSKTSMEDIAKAAGRGRRTIYTHFNNKREVFKAVIDMEVERLAGLLAGIVEQPVPPREKLRRYMHARMNAIRELTLYYEAIREDLAHDIGLLEELRRDYDEQEAGMIRSILDEGNAAGVFGIKDTSLVAKAIVMATKGFELPIYMGQQDYDHSSLIDPLMNILYSGIRNRRRGSR